MGGTHEGLLAILSTRTDHATWSAPAPSDTGITSARNQESSFPPGGRRSKARKPPFGPRPRQASPGENAQTLGIARPPMGQLRTHCAQQPLGELSIEIYHAPCQTSTRPDNEPSPRERAPRGNEHPRGNEPSARPCAPALITSPCRNKPALGPVTRPRSDGVLLSHPHPASGSHGRAALRTRRRRKPPSPKKMNLLIDIM